MSSLATVLKTYNDCIEEVLQFGFNDGPQVNKGRIEKWINEGQRMIARKVNAPEFRETNEITLVQAKYKYTLPVGWLRIDDIFYPEMLMRLRYVDLQNFDSLGVNKEFFQSPPALYTTYKEELWVYPPAPANAGALEVRYFASPTTLVNAGDIPVLNEHYLHLLVDYAVTRAYEAEDDAEMAAQHKQRWLNDVAEYRTDMNRQETDRPRQIEGTWAPTVRGSQGVWY